MLTIPVGATDVSILVEALQSEDNTSPGQPLTALTFASVSTIRYRAPGAAANSLTPITLASATAAHDDGGFIKVDDTNEPGLYRLDLPDAMFTVAASQIVLTIILDPAVKGFVRKLALRVEATHVAQLHARLFGKHEQNLATGVHKFYAIDGTTVLMQRVETQFTDGADPALRWAAP